MGSRGRKLGSMQRVIGNRHVNYPCVTNHRSSVYVFYNLCINYSRLAIYGAIAYSQSVSQSVKILIMSPANVTKH